MCKFADHLCVCHNHFPGLTPTLKQRTTRRANKAIILAKARERNNNRSIKGEAMDKKQKFPSPSSIVSSSVSPCPPLFLTTSLNHPIPPHSAERSGQKPLPPGCFCSAPLFLFLPGCLQTTHPLFVCVHHGTRKMTLMLTGYLLYVLLLCLDVHTNNSITQWAVGVLKQVRRGVFGTDRRCVVFSWCVCLTNEELFFIPQVISLHV